MINTADEGQVPAAGVQDGGGETGRAEQVGRHWSAIAVVIERYQSLLPVVVCHPDDEPTLRATLDPLSYRLQATPLVPSGAVYRADPRLGRILPDARIEPTNEGRRWPANEP